MGPWSTRGRTSPGCPWRASSRSTPEELCADVEELATAWRTVEELRTHQHEWLTAHEGRDPLAGQQPGRHLVLGHGGLVRRPANGDWTGQGAPVYRPLPPVAPAGPADAVRLHLVPRAVLAA